MTSAVVISSAVARIKSLNLKDEQKEPGNYPGEAGKLLEGLEEIREILLAAKPSKTDVRVLQVEKIIVRLSYEIVDAITDEQFRRKRTHRRTGHGKFQKELQDLSYYRDKLKVAIDQESTGGVPSEMQGEKSTGPEQDTESSTLSESEEKKMVDQLREILLNPSYKVLYIVGTSGVGKTTLARNLFFDHKVREHFEICSWVPMNRKFRIKGVLRVFQQQQLVPDIIRAKDEIETVNLIFGVLRDKSCLLVLDDIETMDDWESIQFALPLPNTKVIITTCSNLFPSRFYPETYCYISGLTQPVILSLLSKEGFSKPGSHKIKEAIYNISGGRPLLATILGKSLASDAATASEQDLVDELHSYKPYKGTPKVLGACYNRLAPELKLYLLYLSQFPPGQDIPVDKLYLLLAAENFVPPKKSQVFPQSFRQDLDKLAHLMLVEVQEDTLSPDGLYKSCRLHNQVRDFCRLKMAEEEFLEIVDFGTPKIIGYYTRRLAIYMSKYTGENFNFLLGYQVMKIWSLLIFDTFELAKEKSGWVTEIHELTEFSHLRVLSFADVNFRVRKLPKGLDRLMLLKFLSFRGCWLEELPSSMGILTQLETLDLLVHAECKLFIPNSLLTNMSKMMHLYLPRLYHTDRRTKLQLQGLERLEILVNFNMEISEVRALSVLNTFKILSIISEGRSSYLHVFISSLNERAVMLQHLSVEITSFDGYDRNSVSTLKELLRCKIIHSIHIEGQIGELPDNDACSVSVAEMVLDGSELQLDPMSYLGKFQNLRSLVISNDAFLGTQILISALPLFPNLRSLKLQNLKYLQKLTIEEGAMPKLSNLQIDSCGWLLELSIPKELYDRLNMEKGGDAYSVTPLPSTVNITT